MKFAAISDIHANSAALEAVIADIRGNGIDDIVCLGDVASGPMEARKTIDRLIELGITTVRGNHDRYLIEQSPEEMGSWELPAYRQLETKHLDWLRSLPPTRIYRDDVFLCHATPANDNLYWLEAVRPDGSVCMAPLEDIAALAEGIGQSLILCGHTHIQRAVRLLDGRLIVNPGSVGCPGFVHNVPYDHVVQMGTPDACYAIIERRGDQWRVALRQVPYDCSAMVAAARAYGQEDWIEPLETGWIGQR